MYKAFTCSILLATTPFSFVYPQDAPPQIILQKLNEQHTESILSYDEIMHLLDELESGELEKRCSFEDLEKIDHFLALLAKEGILPNESEEDLSDDVEELLNADNPYKYVFSLGDSSYMVVPAIANEYGEMILCKSWLGKKWKKTKKFVKKHKKAIIIGAAIVVAATVVAVAIVASSATAASAAGAAGSATAAAASKSHKQEYEEEAVSTNETSSAIVAEAPLLKEAMDEQIFSFKENIVNEQFFQPSNPLIQQDLSWEENGRMLGALFAHDSLKKTEQQNTGAHYPFSLEGSGGSFDFGHLEIDRKFTTDYTSLYTSEKETDFTTLSYQARGERALDYGYLTQAVHDLGKAIELNPANPLPYLERGFAHFGLGQYDSCLEDYHTYTSQTPKASLSIPEFSLGFAKALPKGIYDSGKGIFLFVSDLVTHPVRTGEQIWDVLSLLSKLACSEQWGALSEVIAPEVHQLVKEWDTLPSDTRGELAGYAFGKHGSDIFIPGALARAISKGVKGAQELSSIYKGLQTAEKTLLLESVTGLESAKIAEVIQSSQRTIILGEELGFTPHQMGQLKQAGNLENAVTNTFENISKNPAMRESFEFFKKAEAFLKPYKAFMEETQCRELIHQTGIQTFPRPKGIPESFRIKITGKGGGMEYVHPTNKHLRIRVMPGKPHSPLPHQQKPYVIQKADGKALDKLGNPVSPDVPEAHIPLEEFTYRNKLNVYQ
jgi:tetratricopeptide (TPR) repeat protein